MMFETNGIEDVVFKLHEIGLYVNELKQNGTKEIPIKIYEDLLEYSIYNTQVFNDYFNSIDDYLSKTRR